MNDTTKIEIPAGHAFRFRNWNQTFENNRSREVHLLTYHLQPNKLEGECLGFMLMQPDGLELYGTLGFLKIVASRGRPQERGWLARNGSGLTATRIACLARIPAEKIPQIERALRFFSTPPMDWLELCPLQSDGTPSAPGGQSDGTPSAPHRHPDGIGTASAPHRHPDGTKTTVLTDLLKGQTEYKKEGGEHHLPESVSDEVVKEFAEKWPGEPSSGAPRMPGDFVDDWLARMNGRTVGWPKDWQRSLISDWRTRFKTWRKDSGKTRAPKKREAWQVEKDLAVVREQIRTHPAKTWPANRARDLKLDREFEGLKKKRGALEQELKGK